MKQKLLLILALLLMAATGAWADTVVLGSPNSDTATLSDENGIITLSAASNSITSIELGPGSNKIPYGDTEYKPMKLAANEEFTLSFKAGVTINKVTLMAMSADNREGTVGGGDGDYSSLGTLPSKNSDGNCLTVDITNNTGLKFSRRALAIIVVEYSTTSTVAVTLDKTEASMTVGGDALTLTATVAPDDATDKTVTWTTSDANVATVADGVVTAVGAGTATITATATNGTVDTSDDKTATCTVTVAAPDPTYIVAGNYAEIFEIPWYGTYEANKMTKGGDGKYTKTYNVEDAFSDIQLKVVKDGEDWIGDETGDNVTFSMIQAGSFTVTLDPNANPVYVTVTGDNVVFANTEYAINYATGMQNGTVTGPDTAKEDDEVTLTITPAAGYVLESISVTGVTTENAVEVTDGKFTMPAEDVNVIATFKLVTYAIFAIDTDGTTQDFGSVEADATAQKTFTITNSGNKSLYVTISNSEDFTAEMTQNANVYFADAMGWGDIHVYYWPDGPEWPGAAMTELYTNELGQKVYCYELPADIEGVIFNGNGNMTGDIREPIGKAYYIKDDNTVGTWSYDNCVPAGMSRVLTVTMNTATLGSKSGNITLSFDAKNATSFTIPFTGEVAAPAPTTYSITVKEGTEDAGNWTVSPNPAEAGQTVTISYTGTKKVKSIKAVKKAAPAPAVPDGAINGKFSVSDTKQVYFSKGNLRYASGTWSFFDNQYDCYTSYSADAWDKFGWSTSAPTYGMNTSSSDSDYSGDFVDWGATMGTGWFTLSSAEWTYLFNTRSASTVGGTENGRYAKAKVNNVQGVIFFPDTYTHPDGVTAPTGVNVTGNTGWNGNNYSSADWTKMESAGCVFLPAAGYRDGSSVDDAGSLGYYWSATPLGTDYAYSVTFGSGNQNPAYDDFRGYGFSVRLVRQVTE